MAHYKQVRAQWERMKEEGAGPEGESPEGGGDGGMPPRVGSASSLDGGENPQQGRKLAQAALWKSRFHRVRAFMRVASQSGSQD